MHPVMMAGMILFHGIFPCLNRKQMAVKAEGRKNKRLIPRTVTGSDPITNVSHSTSRLPPPTPNPARKPRTVPTMTINGKLPNIDIGSLPIKPGFPAIGGAILRGYAVPIFLQETLRIRCPANREEQPENPQCLSTLSSPGKPGKWAG